MQTLSTAQVVVSMLEVNGIDTLYCLPGVQNDPFFDALYDATNAIRPIHARHEQGCAYMALGYAMTGSTAEQKMFTEVMQEAAARATAKVKKREAELIDDSRFVFKTGHDLGIVGFRFAVATHEAFLADFEKVFLARAAIGRAELRIFFG